MNKSGEDKNASQRKADHIDLAFNSQTPGNSSDTRFYYEPVTANPANIELATNFMGLTYENPLWISSMTGGAQKAGVINKNLAMLSSKYGLGMGLGSCRQLLYDDTYLGDFAVRKYIGDRPLYANLGIAQMESLVSGKELEKVKELIKKLNADGLIIHVNPLQEFIQPEGDRLNLPAIETIKNVLDSLDCNIIVKEVGQGMGPESLRALLQLPLAAIETAAFGGTNFAKLEMLRQKSEYAEQYAGFINVGHDAGDMVNMINKLLEEAGNEVLCRNIIISGGVKSFLDGYYYMEKINLPAIYGMASQFLKYALISFEVLDQFMTYHLEGLKMARAFLRIKYN